MSPSEPGEYGKGADERPILYHELVEDTPRGALFRFVHSRKFGNVADEVERDVSEFSQ